MTFVKAITISPAYDISKSGVLDERQGRALRIYCNCHVCLACRCRRRGVGPNKRSSINARLAMKWPGPNKVGPSLKGLFGRNAGSLEGFAYSEAMKDSGVVWSQNTLRAYLADPKAAVPNTKMSFTGLKKDEEFENILKYLKEGTK